MGLICCTPRRYVGVITQLRRSEHPTAMPLVAMGVITQLGKSEHPTVMPLAANGFRGLLC